MAETIFGGLSGSQNYLVVNPDGSINISGTIGITGDIVIGSVSASVDSVYIQSGANIDLGSAWTNIGSVLVSNPSAIGSLGIQTISGIVDLGNVWKGVGSVLIIPASQSIGSVEIATNLAQIGSYAGVGSIIGSVYQLSSPWVISGTSTIAGSVYSTGSINIVSPSTIGSYTRYEGSEVWTFGSVYSTGSINIATDLTTIGSYTRYIGSESYIKAGSVQTYSPLGIGSMQIFSVDSSNALKSPFVANGSYLMIAGSISSMPSISVATGSEVYVKGGSIVLYSGTTYVDVVTMPGVSTGSEVYIKGGSIFLYSGATFYANVTQTTNPWVISGTANISGVFIGISGVVNQGTINWGVSGTLVGILGSTINLSNAGSNPIYGSIFVTGSINQSTAPWMISGLQWSVGISGAVIQGTNPWVISGTANISGVFIGISGVVNPSPGSSYLVSTPGSVGVYSTNAGLITTYPIISQDYSGAGHTTTGSKLLWSPIAGSKAQIQAFSVSTDVPQRLSLYFSGTVAPANRQIWAGRLPASGTAGLNLFGILCSGPVDAALGLVVNVAGNIESTVWTRSLA